MCLIFILSQTKIVIETAYVHIMKLDVTNSNHTLQQQCFWKRKRMLSTTHLILLEQAAVQSSAPDGDMQRHGPELVLSSLLHFLTENFPQSSIFLKGDDAS